MKLKELQDKNKMRELQKENDLLYELLDKSISLVESSIRDNKRYSKMVDELLSIIRFRNKVFIGFSILIGIMTYIIAVLLMQ